MDRYRIIPAHRAYKVVQVEPNGAIRPLKTWRTEEDAVSHLKTLRDNIERTSHRLNPGEKDWRG
jgi:hypothetical protein